MQPIDVVDPEVADLIRREEARQHNTLKLIASENYASPAVMSATGSVFTNKYSEGYPGRRYYEGQQVVDPLENLARGRATALFGMDHANVQPYSGSPANLAVYAAFCEPGDAVMGMSLPMGGHLTHGWKASVTGRWFTPVQYDVVRETGRVDLDRIRDLALRHRPRVIFCGGTAVPRQIDFAGFARIAQEVDAVLVADIAHIAGLVAGGAHPSPAGLAPVITTTTHKTLRGPRGAMILCDAQHSKAIDRAVFPGLQGGPHNHTTAGIAVALKEAASTDFAAYARQVVRNAAALADVLIERGYRLVSGGTDNHLILVDLTDHEVGGRAAAQALTAAGVEVNFNGVPFDPRPPMDPSGVRLGTAAITTRGMTETDMSTVGDIIDRAVKAGVKGDDAAIAAIRADVAELLSGFPVWP